MDQALNIVLAQIKFSPVNSPGKVDCIMNWRYSPHEYFLHLFGKDFLDVFIAETKFLDGKFWQVSLQVALDWKPIGHEEHLVFFG